MRDAGEHAAADRRSLALRQRRALAQRRRQPRQPPHAEHRNLQQQRRADQQERRRHLRAPATRSRAEPTIAPSVAPAAMKPNSRLPCSELKMSTTIAQKIETTNRLNTDIQMKKTRPIHTVCSRRRPMQRRAEQQDGDGEEAVGQRDEPPRAAAS